MRNITITFYAGIFLGFFALIVGILVSIGCPAPWHTQYQQQHVQMVVDGHLIYDGALYHTSIDIVQGQLQLTVYGGFYDLFVIYKHKATADNIKIIYLDR